MARIEFFDDLETLNWIDYFKQLITSRFLTKNLTWKFRCNFHKYSVKKKLHFTPVQTRHYASSADFGIKP